MFENVPPEALEKLLLAEVMMSTGDFDSALEALGEAAGAESVEDFLNRAAIGFSEQTVRVMVAGVLRILWMKGDSEMVMRALMAATKQEVRFRSGE